MRRALMGLNLYGIEAVRHKLRNRQKMYFWCFLGHFWAYVGQPNGHMGWATSMPFISINSINPRTNPWYLHKKILRIWRFWKTHFFWGSHFEFFFSKKYFFCFIPMKISHKLCVRIDGTQFLRLWWFTAKNHSPQTYQPAVYSYTKYFIIELYSKGGPLSGHFFLGCQNNKLNLNYL